jgi:hypothetical protein
MIVLYRSTLLSNDAVDFFPMTQYKSFTFRSVCFVLPVCCVHVSLESKCSPRYSQLVIVELLFMCTAGHCCFLSVKVTCTDLVTLKLIRHFIAKLLVGLVGPGGGYTCHNSGAVGREIHATGEWAL